MENNWRRKILTIWFGQSISMLTSSVFQMCIVWYLTIETGSASVLTYGVIAAYVPQAVIGMFTGVFVDRFDKKKIIILSDLFIASVSLILAVVASAGELPVLMVFFVLAVRSMGTALHEPATQSLTPLLVPEAYLTKYAGYSQTFMIVSHLISPGLSLFLNSILPLHYIVFLDVIGALIAVLFIAPVKIKKQTPIKRKIHLITDFKEGLGALKRTKGMITLMVVGMLYCIIYAPVGTLYPHITMVYFEQGTDMAASIEFISAIGSLIGSLLLGWLGAKLNRFLGLIFSMMGYGIGLVITGFLPTSGIWFFAGISLLMGITIPIYYGIITAIFQLKVEEEYLGRAFAISQSANDLAMPIGLIISGHFADIIGANVLFLILGILTVILSLSVLGMKSVRKCCE